MESSLSDIPHGKMANLFLQCTDIYNPSSFRNSPMTVTMEEAKNCQIHLRHAQCSPHMTYHTTNAC
jgi:hypothetical protein